MASADAAAGVVSTVLVADLETPVSASLRTLAKR